MTFYRVPAECLCDVSRDFSRKKMRNLNLYRYVFASSSVYTELNFDFGWLMVVSVSPRLPWHPSNFCRPTTRIFPEKVRKHSNEKLAPGSLHFYYFRRGTRSNQSKIQTLSHHTHGLWSTSSRIWALSPWHPYLLLWSRFNQWTRLLAEQKKKLDCVLLWVEASTYVSWLCQLYE